MHTDIGSATFQDGLIGDDEGFGLLVCFANDRNRLCNGSVGWSAGLSDNIGEHEPGSEFDDAGFMDLSVDGNGCFGYLAVDADDGRITQIIFHETFANDDFNFVASFFCDIDFSESWEGNGSAGGDLKFAAEFRLTVDAYFKAIPRGEFAQFSTRGAGTEKGFPILCHRSRARRHG